MEGYFFYRSLDCDINQITWYRRLLLINLLYIKLSTRLLCIHNMEDFYLLIYYTLSYHLSNVL